MKNNWLITSVLWIGLAPHSLFGQQQKQDIMVNKMLLPALAIEASRNDSPNNKYAKKEMQKISDLPLRLQDVKPSALGTILSGKNATLQMPKKEPAPNRKPDQAASPSEK
jgi:hypothetical protein